MSGKNAPVVPVACPRRVPESKRYVRGELRWRKLRFESGWGSRVVEGDLVYYEPGLTGVWVASLSVGDSASQLTHEYLAVNGRVAMRECHHGQARRNASDLAVKSFQTYDALQRAGNI